MQQQFCRDQTKRAAFSLVHNLQQKNYQVRYAVDDENIITMVFFIHHHAIDEIRQLPESVVLDCTYKMNSHSMVLLNIVIAGTVLAKEERNQLVTVPVAGCWMDHEKEANYNWALSQFREIVWPSGSSWELPHVFVTDNDKALRNAIKVIFPESSTLLCYIHVTRNFVLKFTKEMSAVTKSDGNKEEL